MADVSLWEFSGQECYYGLHDNLYVIIINIIITIIIVITINIIINIIITRSLRPLHRQHELHPPCALQPCRSSWSPAGTGKWTWLQVNIQFLGKLKSQKSFSVDLIARQCSIFLEIKNLKNLSQVTFWLSFLQSRIPPVEPLGDCGRSVLTFFILFKCSLSPFSFSSSVHFHLFHSLQAFTFTFFILFKWSLSLFSFSSSVHFHLFHSLQVFTFAF